MKPPIHIVHLMYRFAAGGMENVIVQLINHLPHSQFRHTIVALTSADPAFIQRLQRADVEVITLDKPPGQPFRLYPKVWRLFRHLRPDVLHSCNLAALEFAPVAAAAGVPLRVHAEHGWDVSDPDGRNPRYRLLRRLYRPFVSQWIAVSAQLHDYLRQHIHVPAQRLHLVPNGVDTERFRPAQAGEAPPADYPFRRGEHRVIGTVGRLEPIKNQALLVDAFIQCVAQAGADGAALRLAIVGDGPLAPMLRARMADAGLPDRLWLPGTRSDIPELLRAFDLFVLPSLAEGTSCTLQEAMASGVPVAVTDVGGNRDLLADGRLGTLVPTQDVTALASALQPEPPTHCEPARQAIVEQFSLPKVIATYARLFCGMKAEA